jgi:Rad3-related DNA helicase
MPWRVSRCRLADETDGGAPIAVIEAGTGTGKTIAYVIPAIIMARSLGKRLVIATATVALQEQLMHKDLPDIQTLAAAWTSTMCSPRDVGATSA